MAREENQSSIRTQRRSFICRLRVGNHDQKLPFASNLSCGDDYLNCMNTHNSTGNTENYVVMQITGYTKRCSMVTNTEQVEIYDRNRGYSQNDPFCLIAVARIQVTSMPNDTTSSSNSEFVTKIDQNGIITFVDQKYDLIFFEAIVHLMFFII